VSDYSRYMPRDTSARGIISAVFFGAAGSAVWLIALGAWLATRLGVSDGLVGLREAGDNVAAPLGSITAFLSAAALLATMGMNAYGAMLTALTGIDSFRPIRVSRRWRAVTVLVLAVAWYAIAAAISASGSATAVSSVSNSLTLMLYLLVPWTALNLADFFFVRRGHYAITDIFAPDGVYHRWGWRGLTAYAAGFAAEIPFMVLPPLGGWSYTGWIPAHLTSGVDYSWIVGLLVSGLLYLALSRTLDLTAERAAIEASEAALRELELQAGPRAVADAVHGTGRSAQGGRGWPGAGATGRSAKNEFLAWGLAFCRGRTYVTL
jgi:purine-cytosine permease-like protein